MLSMSSKRLQKAIDQALKPMPRLERWPCRHFPVCGGCALQDVAYPDQVMAKRAALLQLWGELLPAALRADFDVVPAPEPFGYRLRMDYVCSDDRFGLRMRRRYYAIVDLHECHLIPPALFATLREVYQAARDVGLPDYNVYHNTGFLRYLVLRRNRRDAWLLALVTSAAEHASQIEQVARAALTRGALGVWWIVNPRPADVSFGAPVQHWGEPYLPQYVLDRTLLIGPNTFFQNNIAGFEQILRYIAPFVAGAQRLVDLYAGVGTIGICLAEQVGHVFAAELSEEAVALAQRNIALNGLDGRVEVVTADVAAILRDERTRGDVLVVDPPRAGLGAEVCALLREHGPPRIVYVSCNPITQRSDVELLGERYLPVAARGFDLFPQTYHCEQVVVLERRS